MTLRTAVLLGTALSNGGLSLYLWWRFRAHRIHRLLAGVIAGSAAYGLFLAGLAAAADQPSAEWWVRCTTILPYLLLISLFRFCLAFGRREQSAWARWMGRTVWASALVDSLGRLSGAIPTHLVLDGQQGWYPDRDPYYSWVYAPLMLVSVLSALAVLGRAWARPSTPGQRRQIGYLWLALAGGFSMTWFNPIPDWRFLASTAPLVTNLVVVYALTRHRLLDLDLVLREGAAAALASLCLTGICALLVLVDLRALGGGGGWGPLAASALAFALLYLPLQRLFWRVLGPWLGGPPMDLSRELLHFWLDAQQQSGLTAQLESTMRSLVERLGLSRAEILLQDQNGDWRTYQQWPKNAPAAVPVEQQALVALALLSRPWGLDRHGLGWTQDYETKRSHGTLPEMDAACLRFLDGRKAQAAFGLSGGKHLYGALVVGAPTSGRPMRRDEVGLLCALTTQLAALVEQSALHGTMRESDRMSAVGTLAGSVAHDLRNPLASVGMFIQMLPQKGNDPEFMAKFQRLVPSELKKLNSLTEQLLSLSRPATRAVQVVDLGALCTRVHHLVGHQFMKHGVDLRLEVPEGILVHGTEEGLSQVLLNLLLNAQRRSNQGDTVRLRLEAHPKGAELWILDQGSPLSPAQMARVFEPYFTPEDQGHQPGLPTSLSILTDLGGELKVANPAEGGLGFCMVLPLAPMLLPAPSEALVKV
jgi:signal transduction histidine kinase